MPAATRQGDNCTGHDACPPVPLVEYSGDVNINGRGAGRLEIITPPTGAWPTPATLITSPPEVPR